MAREFVEVLDLTAADTVISGVETIAYQRQIDGGLLGDINSVWLLARGKLSLSSTAAAVIVRLKYGDLVATATLKVATNVISDAGLVIEGMLSGDSSPNLQLMHLNCSFGTEVANIAGTPLHRASGSETSGDDKDLILTLEVVDGSGDGLSVIPDEDNVGDGVFSSLPTIGVSAEDGDYVLVCTEAAEDGGTFSVTSPSGASLDPLVVGTPYVSAHFSGTLVDGATDFELDDTIIVRIVSSSIATVEHVRVLYIAYIEDPEPTEPELPNTIIYSIKKITLLPHRLFKDVRFYGEFIHSLDYIGIGTATLARATAQNATWRDGGAHSVAANKPRFEYNGATPLGLLINSAVGETLTIPAANNLHDANTLFWRENNVTKNSGTTANPFNSSGVWSGTDNIHISHVLKFSRVLTAAEIALVTGVLDSPNP